MSTCVLYAEESESYIISWCCDGGATQSLLPLNNNVGIEIFWDAVMDDGFVFAAAKETIVVTVELFSAARKELPPPIECPIMAEVIPTLDCGIDAPAPLL